MTKLIIQISSILQAIILLIAGVLLLWVGGEIRNEMIPFWIMYLCYIILNILVFITIFQSKWQFIFNLLKIYIFIYMTLYIAGICIIILYWLKGIGQNQANF